MPGPSWTTSRSWMRVSHFCEHEPDQLGTTSRSGAPFSGWSGALFISKAIGWYGSIAFATGTPRLRVSFVGYPRDAGRRRHGRWRRRKA